MATLDPYSSADLSALLDRLVGSAKSEFADDGYAIASVVEALAEAEQFEAAIRLLERIPASVWKAEAAGYVAEALARAGRVDEADGIPRRMPPSIARPYGALIAAKTVQGLVGAGRLQEAVGRLGQFSVGDIVSWYEVFPRLVCLDAFLRTDDRAGAEALLRTIQQGTNRDEKCLGNAWMALGLNAWGDHPAALRHARRAERWADPNNLPWVVGVYEALGAEGDAARVKGRWEKNVEKADQADTLRFFMARAMANLQRYDDALRYASEIEEVWLVAKVYACIAYVMFNSGDHERFVATFEKAVAASESLDGSNRIHALSDVAIVMAWVQRLGINVSCVTPILRASLALAKVP